MSLPCVCRPYTLLKIRELIAKTSPRTSHRKKWHNWLWSWKHYAVTMKRSVLLDVRINKRHSLYPSRPGYNRVTGKYSAHIKLMWINVIRRQSQKIHLAELIKVLKYHKHFATFSVYVVQPKYSQKDTAIE